MQYISVVWVDISTFSVANIVNKDIHRNQCIHGGKWRLTYYIDTHTLYVTRTHTLIYYMLITHTHTYIHTQPERILGGEYGIHSEIWSLGISVLEVQSQHSQAFPADSYPDHWRFMTPFSIAWVQVTRGNLWNKTAVNNYYTDHFLSFPSQMALGRFPYLPVSWLISNWCFGWCSSIIRFLFPYSAMTCHEYRRARNPQA